MYKSRLLGIARARILLVFIAALVSTSSYASTCPTSPDPTVYNGACIDGIKPGGYPYFETDISVTWKKKDNSLTASFDNSAGAGVSTFFADWDDPFDITNTAYDFSAIINPSDQDSGTTGHLEITGNIADPDLAITGKPVLMSADLTGVYRQDGALIGFNTMNIVCHTAIDLYVGGCTTDESLYFDLVEEIDFSASVSTKKASGKTKTTGTSLATVPVPPAAWLFGSGLLGLVGVARRK